jgi:hypothetical protein
MHASRQVVEAKVSSKFTQCKIAADNNTLHEHACNEMCAICLDKNIFNIYPF